MYKSYSYYWFVPFNSLFTTLDHVTHDFCLQETEVLNLLCRIQQLELKLTDTENNGLTEKCGNITLKQYYEANRKQVSLYSKINIFHCSKCT